MSQPYMYDENGKLFPWYKSPNMPEPLSPEEYADEMDKFMRGERKKPPAWTIPVINQKQQHMTPISFQDPQLHKSLAKAIRGGDPNISEPILNFVKDQVIPILQKEGLYFSANDSKGTSEDAARMTTQDHMRKDEQEPEPKMRYTDHGVQILSKSSQVHTFDIGTAMHLAKAGKKVARSGWNGRNMFVYYVPGSTYKALTQVAKDVFGEGVPYNHYLAIKNVDGTVSTWAPSGSDALATDWYIVD